MLNIPVEIKEKLKTNTATKNFRVTFPNGERADIINDNIVFESVRFTESVMSQDKFKLGLCESPVIEFEVFGIENIKSKKIECYYEIYCEDTVEDAVYREDLDAYVYPIPLGVFYVDSCKKEAKMNMRRVIAYGEQAYFEWKIPSGAYVNMQGNPIDISVYLALIMQSSAAVNITSEQDISGSVDIYDSSGFFSTPNMNVSFNNDSSANISAMRHNDMAESSVFIDYVSMSESEKSMTLNVEYIIAYLSRTYKELTATSDFNYNLFTFDSVSKSEGADSIKDSIREIFNQYVQTHECRAYDEYGQEHTVTQVNSILYNPKFITQHYAYDDGIPAPILQDEKYALIEDFNFDLDPRKTVYIWNNTKTSYISYSYYRNILYIIVNIKPRLQDIPQFSQAVASLITAWETITGHTWNDYGIVTESDWANGESNVITFGKKINFASYGLSVNNINSLTRDEIQGYAQNAVELNGKISRIDRNGNFEAFTIDTDTLVPNDTDLVPSMSLVPNGADVDTIYPSEYETAWYDDELSLPYGACSATHKVSGTDTYTIVYANGYDADTDPSTYQIYDISNNDLIKEMTVEEITPILTTIITNISNLRYMPSDIDMVGRPDIEAGDGIQVMSNSGAFNTYVLSRTTDGIQGLSDTITAK